MKIGHAGKTRYTDYCENDARKKVQASGTFTAGRIPKGNPMKTERCDKEKTPRRRASPFWRLALETDEPAQPRAKPKSGSTPSGSPRQSVCNFRTAVQGLSTQNDMRSAARSGESPGCDMRNAARSGEKIRIDRKGVG